MRLVAPVPAGSLVDYRQSYGGIQPLYCSPKRRLKTALDRGGHDVPITSIRTGHVPGRHDVCIDGAYEQVLISHEARSRRVFADGALRAALWLRGRRGVFTMDDVLNLEGP